MTTEGSGAAITPRTRARARHILDHYYIGPACDQAVLEIWGYTPRMSYAPGDSVTVHVSTTAPKWDMEIGRDGFEYQPVLSETGLPGHHRDTPEDCSVVGCGWPVSYEFTIPPDWVPGGYLMTFRAHRGEDVVEEHHLILVRSPEATPPPYVLICATGTWLAYNCWGGSNHYEGITGPNRNAFSPIVSTQRPWTRGFCKLPEGAPRTLPEQPPKPGDMVRYPYMEWAYAYGYSKKYASAGWATYERHFARWAEREGYTFDIIAQHDLHSDPEILKRYACAVFVGHDEYWSAEMRDAVEAYTDDGGHVARFAGNFLWQTRIEDEGRTQVCYKYAYEQDPLMGSDNEHLVTGAHEAEPVNRPGATTFGANALRGVYSGLGNCVGSGAGGFTIYRPEHWAFEGTNIGFGDVLGAHSRIFGYEVDGLEYRIEDGLPYPSGTDGAAPEIVILGMGLATNVEADHQIWGQTLYIGSADAAFKARAMYGEVSPDTLDACTRGNGVMIHWPRGKGEIFNAATCEWVAGLIRGDAQVEQVTRNVLDKFDVHGSEANI